MADVLRELKPAVLLLDLGLRRLGGIYDILSLQRLSPSTKILVLTKIPKLRDELYALKLGAKGYSGKDISDDLLRKAVRVVQRGELWMGRKVIPKLLEEVMATKVKFREPSISTPGILFDDLTNKKKEIVRHLADGATNKEIARRLNISEGTVKAHLAAIYRKLAVSNRVQLAGLMATSTKAFPMPIPR